MTGQTITNNGLKIMLNRAFKPSPDYTAPTVFSVGTGTTTPATSDTAIQTVVAINGGNTKTFVSGYPTLDETNLQSTIRCLLLTTEANSNTLTEFGLLNTDSSPLLFSHAVHTGITKTTSVQVTYVEVDKFS